MSRGTHCGRCGGRRPHGCSCPKPEGQTGNNAMWVDDRRWTPEGIRHIVKLIRVKDAEIERLRGAMAADDKRLADAAARVGCEDFGCDAADHMADKIIGQKAEIERLREAITGVVPGVFTGIDPVVMLEEQRKVYRDELTAANAEIERLREQNESLRNTLRFIAAGRIRDDCEQGIDRADSFAVGRMARLAREAVTAMNQPRREE